MNSDEATLAVIDLLEARQVPYMVVGSFSSNYYGVPRSTKDADIVIELKVSAVRSLAEELGDQFRLDPQPTFETVIEFFHLSEDTHDQERFRRRRRVSLGARHVLPAHCRGRDHHQATVDPKQRPIKGLG